MTVSPDSFIRADFRHTASDLLVRLPYRLADGGTAVEVYFLFEHKASADSLTVPQVLGYVGDLYNRQIRQWRERHRTMRGFLFQAVIPLVLYTGEKKWGQLRSMAELVQGGAELAEFLPGPMPMFISLPALAKDVLSGPGGAFGRVLGLLQDRSAATATFREALADAVRGLESTLAGDAQRLSDLLAYVVGAVYHYRAAPEREELRRVVERTLTRGAVREEVTAMGKTIAEALRDEGLAAGRTEGVLATKRETLLRLLEHRFGTAVTPGHVARVQAARNVTQLSRWFDQALRVDTLAEVGISPLP